MKRVSPHATGHSFHPPEILDCRESAVVLTGACTELSQHDNRNTP